MGMDSNLAVYWFATKHLPIFEQLSQVSLLLAWAGLVRFGSPQKSRCFFWTLHPCLHTGATTPVQQPQNQPDCPNLEPE